MHSRERNILLVYELYEKVNDGIFFKFACRIRLREREAASGSSGILELISFVNRERPRRLQSPGPRGKGGRKNEEEIALTKEIGFLSRASVVLATRTLTAKLREE